LSIYMLNYAWGSVRWAVYLFSRAANILIDLRNFSFDVY
jgi:hypothetical protein